MTDRQQGGGVPEELRSLLLTAKLLWQNSLACTQQHLGASPGAALPGWLEDAQADIASAEKFIAGYTLRTLTPGAEVVVPREPTDEMVAAVAAFWKNAPPGERTFRNIYRIMTRPTASQDGVKKD